MITEMKDGSAQIKGPIDEITGLPIRDRERALRITGGDATLANAMFEQMVRDIPGQIEAFLLLQQEKNWAELKRHVHRLRGSVTYCAVPALEHNLSALESAAASGKPDDIGRHIQVLESIMQRLAAATGALD